MQTRDRLPRSGQAAEKVNITQDCPTLARSAGGVNVRYRLLNRLMADASVPPGARCMGYALVQYSDHDGMAWPSRPALEARSGISGRRIRDAIRSLVECGYVAVTKIRAGDALPSGRPARRDRPIYRIGMPPDGGDTGDVSSPDVSSPDVSSAPQGTYRPPGDRIYSGEYSR